MVAIKPDAALALDSKTFKPIGRDGGRWILLFIAAYPKVSVIARIAELASAWYNLLDKTAFAKGSCS